MVGWLPGENHENGIQHREWPVKLLIRCLSLDKSILMCMDVHKYSSICQHTHDLVLVEMWIWSQIWENDLIFTLEKLWGSWPMGSSACFILFLKKVLLIHRHSSFPLEYWGEKIKGEMTSAFYGPKQWSQIPTVGRAGEQVEWVRRSIWIHIW